MFYKYEDINTFFDMIKNNCNISELIDYCCNHFIVNDIYLKNIELSIRSSVKDAQINSLKIWINYLYENNFSIEDIIWILNGVLRIGSYDLEHDIYYKRSVDTIAPFIQINPSVIAKSLEYKNSSFKKVYLLLLKEFNTMKKNNSVDGYWIKYKYRSKEDAIKLYESLQGFGNPWCSSGSLKLVINQLCGGAQYVGGDFYVYYTLDKMPRLAIRMDREDSIGEIRGVADFSQNIEEDFEEILLNKISELNIDQIQKESAISKINHCKFLTELSKREEISEIEEYKLFCTDLSVFGYDEDKRVEFLRNKFLIKNKSTLLKFLSINRDSIKYIDKCLYTDLDVMKNIIAIDYTYFRKLDFGLRDNKDYVIEMIKVDYRIYKYISDNLKQDKDIFINGCYSSIDILDYASNNILSDRNFALKIMNINGLALKYFYNYYDDIEVVTLAVINNGLAIKYVSNLLADSEALMNIALDTYSFALRYGNAIKSNRKIALKSALVGGSLYDVDDTLKDDEEVVNAFIENNASNIVYASERLKKEYSNKKLCFVL